MKGCVISLSEAFFVRYISRARMKITGFIALDFETKLRAYITKKSFVFKIRQKLLNSIIKTI
jgi:hypothetical protein